MTMEYLTLSKISISYLSPTLRKHCGKGLEKTALQQSAKEYLLDTKQPRDS